jgi:hypothetical protein
MFTSELASNFNGTNSEMVAFSVASTHSATSVNFGEGV